MSPLFFLYDVSLPIKKKKKRLGIDLQLHLFMDFRGLYHIKAIRTYQRPNAIVRISTGIKKLDSDRHARNYEAFYVSLTRTL